MASQSATALLTEHLRYTPLTLIDEVVNMVNEVLFASVNKLDEALSNAPLELLGFSHNETLDEADPEAIQTPEEMRHKEIDLGIVQIESLLNATTDKDMDKFELYTLRNILSIGHAEDADLVNWLCLDHYRHLTHHLPLVMPESIHLQRRKLHETHKLNLMLKEEEARNDRVIKALEALKKENEFRFLMDCDTKQASAELRNVVTQLPLIRERRAQLLTASNMLEKRINSG